MKRSLIVISLGLASLHANASDDTQQAASTLQNVATQQLKSDPNIPDWLKRTDISVQGLENSKPTWSIETVQPIYQTPDSLTNTVFFQGRWGHRNSDNTFNLGLGYRYLLSDQSWLFGINSFYDTTTRYDHQRWGVGAEAIGRYITLRTNYYKAISGEKITSSNNGVIYTEQALDGYDYEIDAPIPYLPWMRIAATGYHWDSATTGIRDMNGSKVTLRASITNHISMELGGSDNNYNNDSFIKLAYNLGGGMNNGTDATLFGGAKSSGAFTARDLTKHTLDKVQRQNEMIVEKKVSGSGGVTIGRGN